MFLKTWSALALSMALLTSHAWAQKTQPAPLRIMPIGDSITEGGDGTGGFRRPLFDKLTAVWGMPNFVGSRNMRQSDPADFADHDEDGYSAYRIEQITTGKGFWDALPIEERLKAWDPAIVTLHAGTNDAQQAYRYAGVIDRLDQLVSRIVAFNPEIHIFLAQIIPANPPASETTQNYIRGLNSQIPGLVDRHRALGHRVYLVDQYTPMLDHPNPDGIHPDAAGYAVMAEVWFQAMMAALPVKPVNPDPGRFWGLQQVDRFSTVSSTPWTLQPNLIRAGSESLAGVQTAGYHGSHPPALLNDGSQAAYSNDRDYTSTTTFSLNTAVAPQGYDLTAIRTEAGLPTADNGDERSHQAYELWWASVDAPDTFLRLADVHHIMVNTAQRASQITLTRPDGSPMAQRVAKLQFRFVQPPARQFGFIGIETPVRYRELEAFGAPSAP